MEGNGLRNLPNAITVSRILFAVVLLFVQPFSGAWYGCYLWCGASDVLDGLLARKLHASTPVGSKLDSAADCALVAVVAVSCVPVLTWDVWMIIWIVGIAAVRMATLAVCRKRFGCMRFLHTWANKATGLVLFVAFALVPVSGFPVVCTIACAVATVSSAEELALMVRMPVLDADRRSICSR